MKKLIALILMTLSVSAMAQHGHGHGYGHGYPNGQWRGYGSGWGWGVPAVIGGLLVYEAVRQPTYVQQPVYVQQQPVIVQQQPTYTTTSSNPTCTPWTEVQSSDGTTTRTRTCTQ
jgi:hypothetical protein